MTMLDAAIQMLSYASGMPVDAEFRKNWETILTGSGFMGMSIEAMRIPLSREEERILSFLLERMRRGDPNLQVAMHTISSQILMRAALLN